MPFFITSIATGRDSIEAPVLHTRTQRTFGFFNSYGDAVLAVAKNMCNMHECLYDLLVIEQMEEGIHPESLREEWYQWDEKENKWTPCLKPNDFRGIVNWALG